MEEQLTFAALEVKIAGTTFLVMHMVNINLDVSLQRNVSSQNPSVL
jgi:hypothetical protein